MIFKNLWRRKSRTLLTILGIAIGVAAVVSLSAFGEGFATGFEKTFSSADADITVGQKDAIMLLLSAVDEEVGTELKQLPGVADVEGTIASFVALPDAPYFVVMGQEPRGFPIQHYRIVEGQPLTARRQVLLGQTSARIFKKKVGDTFRIQDLRFRVVGIYETGVSMEDGGAVITLSDAQRAFDKRYQVSYFNIKVKDVRRLDELKATIESRWPELAATRSGDATMQSEMLNIYRSFGWVLGIFAVLVGGLGMMNTTLMSVFERTREIGLLRAVGWRRRRIIGLIVGEALALAVVGGIAGIVLGVGLTELARTVPAVESMLTGIFTPILFVQAMLTAILLGIVGAVYPAWRAARLAPVEAMRYESGAGLEPGPVTRAVAGLSGNAAWRNLWRRPTRTFVTATGIGIGVGFVVALIALTAGFSQMFNQLGQVGQIDLLAQQADAADASLSVIDERTADRIALRPEVKSIAKMVLGFSTVPELPYFMAWGLDPREDYVEHFRMTDGRRIARPREIMIGRIAANGLKKGVGDSIRISGSSYEIVGIYENGAVFEDAGSVLLLKEAQDIFRKPRQISFLGVSVNEPERADEIARELEREFPDLRVAKTTNFTERMQDMQTAQAVVNTLVGLMVVVGGVVMMNTMLMSVFERTQEIGVLRALGWRRRRIIGMVVVESLLVSLFAGVIGSALGLGLAFALTLEPTMGYFLQPQVTPQLVLQVLALAGVLGGLGGLYPAWRAASLRPIDALRYE
jgi:ABC-type antimicrobial peptide transport system permease subunit